MRIARLFDIREILFVVEVLILCTGLAVAKDELTQAVKNAKAEISEAAAAAGACALQMTVDETSPLTIIEIGQNDSYADMGVIEEPAPFANDIEPLFIHDDTAGVAWYLDGHGMSHVMRDGSMYSMSHCGPICWP